MNSLTAARELQESLFSRLKLKDVPYLIDKAAPNQQLDELWTVLRLMEPSLGPEHTTTASLKKMVKLHEFLEHCCTKRNYFL